MNTVAKGDRSCLGRKYRVEIDRPIGSVHPKHEDIIYPINYGFVPDLYAGDGEEQDVYILGVTKPISEAEVTIIAVIERSDDNEDKWVGVTDESIGTPLCYECNIIEAVKFQEQFHTSTCEALYEKTCGSVMFTMIDGERHYLLIENADSKHIGFPKGHVEYGEDEIQTVIREVREETGLKAEPLDNFRSEYSYISRNGHHKTAVYYLSRYDFSEVSLQQEEISRSWLLPYDKAMEKLNYPQDTVVLRSAEEFLSKL